MRRVSTTVKFYENHRGTPWGLTTWEKIEPKFVIDTTTGCWLWTAALSHGYAILGKPYIAIHRWMYQEFIGPIPDGFHIDHLCMVTNCINPAHLEAVTHVENMRRASAALTHCKWGHEFDEKNTINRPGGNRGCRACMNRAQREYQARKRLKAVA